MKKQALAVALIMILISGVLLAGCTPFIVKKDAGPIVTREYNFTDFTNIEAGNAFKLDITPSETYSVAITTGEDIFQYLDVSKNGDTLKIDLNVLNISFGFPRLEARITMPELRGLNLSGASKGSAKGFKSTNDFDATVSGASQLDMDMETGNFDCEASGASQVKGQLKALSSSIDLSGASQIELAGSGGNMELDASGASDAHLENFTIDDADINLSGASEASIDANGRLDVTLSGASSLQYQGSPILGNFNVTGGSELKQR